MGQHGIMVYNRILGILRGIRENYLRCPFLLDLSYLYTLYTKYSIEVQVNEEKRVHSPNLRQDGLHVTRYTFK